MGCHPWRRSTCSVIGSPGWFETAKCMCGDDECPMNGECVKAGSCPRYTGSQCMLFGCAIGECNSNSYCTCPEGQCFVDGKCVEATAENVRLSREWGASQGDTRAASEAHTIAAAKLGAAAAFPLGFGVAVAVRRMQGAAGPHQT